MLRSAIEVARYQAMTTLVPTARQYAAIPSPGPRAQAVAEQLAARRAAREDADRERIAALVSRCSRDGQLDRPGVDAVLATLGANGGIGAHERALLRPLLRSPALTESAADALRTFLNALAPARYVRP